MRAVRPYLTTGVALVGASVISAAPLAPPPAPDRISDQQVSLTAASTQICPQGPATPLCGGLEGLSAGRLTNARPGVEPSLLYASQNLLNAFLSLPAWEIQAMDRFADAMRATGSWQVWSPTNVFGFDEQDPAKLQAYIDMLIPFQPFSSVLGEHLSWWARANLPMNAGCAALPGACPDPDALLDGMFTVPMSQLYSGYTFPTVTNPFTGEETSWSGQHVQLDPWEPFTSSWEWLVAPPQPVETVSLGEAFDTTQKLITSVFASYYPFVQNSEWYNDEQTALAPLFRALAPILCENCDPDNPYDNPWLYENYPPNTVEQDDPSDEVPEADIEADVDGGSDAPAPVTDVDSTQRSASSDSDVQSFGDLPEQATDTAADVDTGTESDTETLDADKSSVAATEAAAEEVSESGRHRGSAEGDYTSVHSLKDRIESENNGSSDDEPGSSRGAGDGSSGDDSG
ncbi:MAG: hypothetical protein KDB44_10195, partial [Mycobacterium sp.]|nr:hypothetical protein [Mycobacterium sp.]